MIWVKRQDETAYIVDEGFWEVRADFPELGFEVRECFGLIMQGDKELSESLVVKSRVVVYFLCNFGHEREKIEVVEVILGHG